MHGRLCWRPKVHTRPRAAVRLGAVCLPAWSLCKGRLGLAVALILGGLRFAPTALRCSVPRPRRRTRFVRCAHSAQTPAASQRLIRAAREGRGPCAPRRLPCAPQPAPAHLCNHRVFSPPSRADMSSGLGESGGPWSEVKEETSAAREPKAHGRPKAGDMSGRGHPARPAHGTHFDSRRSPTRTTATGREQPFANSLESRRSSALPAWTPPKWGTGRSCNGRHNAS